MTAFLPVEHRPSKVAEWVVSPDLKDHLDSRFPRVNLERAYERFRAHHMAKATRSSCWDAAFINWVAQDDDKIGEQTDDGTTDYRGVPNSSRAQWDRHLMGRHDEGTQA